MRPQVGGDSQPLRPRKRSSADLGPSTFTNATPTSFMIGTEKDLEAYLDGSESTADTSRPASSADDVVSDSTYGVRSINESELADSAVSDRQDAMDQEHGNEEIARIIARRRSTIRPLPPHRRGSISGVSITSFTTNGSSSPEKDKGKGISRDPSDVALSQPITPVSHASPGLYSDAPPSPRSSILHSDDEFETGSQAVMSSSSEEDAEDEQAGADLETTSPAGLQLVMPSLMMPSRRPFTEQGKRLGRLKVLLTGASGVGKTSLIKSIVQTCDDVVHIDSPSPSSSQASVRKVGKKSSTNPTKQITEIHGSTKPYPGWWSQIEDSQFLRRRKSGVEEVLERNISFVDTPGYEKNSASVLEDMEAVLQYVQTQMSRAISPGTMHDSELLGFLSGAGGIQVDVILFLFQSEPTTVEVEFFEQLSKLAFVIPLLSKSDLVTENEQATTCSKITQSLKSTGSHLLPPYDGLSEIYSVCSSPSKDLESMDASLLMSSGYLEPLQTSQLPSLIASIFNPSHAAFLKHVAAKKLVVWRQSSPQSMALSPSPLRTNMFAPTLLRSGSGSSRERHAAFPLSPTSAALTYTSSRLLDHKQREERTAQMHLGNWADSLRRRLAAERLQYEKMANRERERWLNDRLDECVFDGKVMNAAEAWPLGGPRPRHLRGCVRLPQRSEEDELDPLDLIKWRRHFLGALQVVGGVSIMSAIALCFAKTFEVDWDWLDEYGLAGLQELMGNTR